MRYEDFIVQLTPATAGSYTARVVESPEGEGEARFELPPSIHDETAWLAAALGEFKAFYRAPGAYRNVRPAPSPAPVSDPLGAIGERLFQSLFAGEVGTLYQRNLGRLSGEDEGLRIRIQMNLGDPALAPLVELPWECLGPGAHDGFLALSLRTPVLRHLALPQPRERPPDRGPLRIVVGVGDGRDLDLTGEQQALEDLGKANGWRVVPVNAPTPTALRKKVWEERAHVLHLMGHGIFDPEIGEGALVLDGQAGAAVSGAALATHLRDARSLRLVVLNACQTAEAAAGAPYTGLATALLRAGVPAVVAMQYPISDQAAITFGDSFYRSLAAGEPVDVAVTEGRLAVASLPGSLEWVTPVLFMRSREGVLVVAPPEVEVPKGRGARWGASAAGLILAAVASGIGWCTFGPGQEPDIRPIENNEPAPQEKETPAADRQNGTGADSALSLQPEKERISPSNQTRQPDRSLEEDAGPPITAPRERPMVPAPAPPVDEAELHLPETLRPLVGTWALTQTGGFESGGTWRFVEAGGRLLLEETVLRGEARQYVLEILLTREGEISFRIDRGVHGTEDIHLQETSSDRWKGNSSLTFYNAAQGEQQLQADVELIRQPNG